MKDKRHIYEYEFDLDSDVCPAYVAQMVGLNKRVLELGCGPGSITKILSQYAGCQVTGIELDPDAIEKVRPFCVQVRQADLNSAGWPDVLDEADIFDVVVAADVLEHLYDPWVALQRMVPFIRPDGYMVISLPHVGHAAVAACLCHGDFEYRDWGLLDRTHIRFFGLKNIEDLFARAELKIIEARYVVRQPEETEFAATWSALPAPISAALNSVAHAHVYQVVVKAVPQSYPGDTVRLVAPKQKHATITDFATWKIRIGARLNPRFRRWLQKSFGLVGIKI